MTRSFYTRFASGVLFPLHERLKGHDTLAARVELERSQWLSPDALGGVQVARLRALLKHAAVRVPYYRSLFARIGFDPDAVRDLAVLNDLPLLSKDLIRTHFEELRADEARNVAMFSTTGSSGDPLRFLIGRRRVSRDVAAKWRGSSGVGGQAPPVAGAAPLGFLRTIEDEERALPRLHRACGAMDPIRHA